MPKKQYDLDDHVPFGTYEGQQIEDMLDDHPSWLAWAYELDVIEFDIDVINEMQKRKII